LSNVKQKRIFEKYLGDHSFAVKMLILQMGVTVM